MRFIFLLGGTTLGFLFAAFHLYTLQIQQNDYYISRIQAQQVSVSALTAARGNIYFTDKSGGQVPAALTKEYPLIYAVPSEIKDAEEASQSIALALELDSQKVRELLSNQRSQFAKLIFRASEPQVKAAQALSLAGLYVRMEKGRFYPLGTLAAHTIGIVGLTQEDDAFRGRYGIEAEQEARLAGRSGRFSENKLIEPKAGENIKTTIDRNVQARAEEIINKLVSQFAPESATIIVEEPASGKIIALANWPTFDPNNYYLEESVSIFLNPALSEVYEPGSIFKVITMAAGLDSGKITPETAYYDSGSVKLNDKVITNWDQKAHGTLTMTQVIEGSVNTGAVFAERTIGNDIFYDYLVKFGLKEPTGIDLPGEVVGSLRPLEYHPQPINFGTAAFGQGVSMTPIRLLSMISAIANNGIMKNPYVTEFNYSDEERRVISKEAARQVTDMMVSAVDKALVAKINNYHVAGKTGTAQIPNLKSGGYLSFDEGAIHSYAGFAPAYNPAFTILIKLERPRTSGLAGQTVVPAFRELTEFLLNYYNIAPTRTINQ